MKPLKAHLIIISVLLLCSLLCGCTKTVEFVNGEIDEDASSISIVINEGETALLDAFPNLSSADLSGSSCYDEIASWAAANPDVSVRYTIELPDGQLVENSAQEIDLSSISAANADSTVSLLRHLPELKSIKCGEGFNAEHITALRAAFPDADIDCTFTFMGAPLSIKESELDLSEANHADIEQLIMWLPVMNSLESIELGSDERENALTWDDICAIHEAAPQAVMSYSFELYGERYTLEETSLNLRYIPISDNGELVKKVTACMPKLEVLDMDGCGVAGEYMAEIRDSLPNTEVIWRVNFGDRYSVRTNVDTILASNPGLGGELTPENTRDLMYCTKVKYLDLGHNTYLTDISFVSYMPELEVIIVAMDGWSDVSPLANCPKLEYAELQTSALNDLRPLAGLKNLRHLNIGYCFALHDLSPIMDLELERLWIGCFTPITPEQVAEYQALHPDCKINTTTVDPTEEGWRYTGWDQYGVAQTDPRYDLLRDQFHYSMAPYSYSYYWTDPLYRG